VVGWGEDARQGAAAEGDNGASASGTAAADEYSQQNQTATRSRLVAGEGTGREADDYPQQNQTGTRSRLVAGEATGREADDYPQQNQSGTKSRLVAAAAAAAVIAAADEDQHQGCIELEAD
jgi:hypothetical protein